MNKKFYHSVCKVMAVIVNMEIFFKGWPCVYFNVMLWRQYRAADEYFAAVKEWGMKVTEVKWSKCLFFFFSETMKSFWENLFILQF